MMKDSDSRVVSRRQQPHQLPPPQQQQHQQQPNISSASSSSTAYKGGSMELLPLHRHPQQQQQQQQHSQPPMATPSKRSRRKSRDRIPFLSSGTMGGSSLVNGGAAGNGSGSSSGVPPPPPRTSGLPSLTDPLDFFGVHRDRTDGASASAAKRARRRYQVQPPCRLLSVLALVFLIVPVLIFLHKEAHIHDGETAHYHTEKYINVNTQDVLSTFWEATGGGDGKNGTGTAQGVAGRVSTAAYLLAADAAAAVADASTPAGNQSESSVSGDAQRDEAEASNEQGSNGGAAPSESRSELVDEEDPNALPRSTTTANSTATGMATEPSKDSKRRLRMKR